MLGGKSSVIAGAPENAAGLCRQDMPRSRMQTSKPRYRHCLRIGRITAKVGMGSIGCCGHDHSCRAKQLVVEEVASPLLEDDLLVSLLALNWDHSARFMEIVVEVRAQRRHPSNPHRLQDSKELTGDHVETLSQLLNAAGTITAGSRAARRSFSRSTSAIACLYAVM